MLILVDIFVSFPTLQDSPGDMEEQNIKLN